MDESFLGDLDEMSLPELSDSVWMRLLANALDPDAPPAGLDLIPVDLPTDGSGDTDDVALLGDDWAPDDAAALPDDDAPDEDDGSDLLTAHADPSHQGDHDSSAFPEQGWDHPDQEFGAQPWTDSTDADLHGGI